MVNAPRIKKSGINRDPTEGSLPSLDGFIVEVFYKEVLLSSYRKDEEQRKWGHSRLGCNVLRQSRVVKVLREVHWHASLRRGRP